MPRKRKRGSNDAAFPDVSAYTGPKTPGSLVGVEQYACTRGLIRKEALEELRGQLAPSRSAKVSHTPLTGVSYRRPMGSRSGGHANVETLESRDAVQIRMGGAIEKQDGESRHGGLRKYFTTIGRPSPTSVADGQG